MVVPQSSCSAALAREYGGQKTERLRVVDWEQPANPAVAGLASQFSVTGALYFRLLGWSPKDNTEKLSLAEVAKRLNLPQILRLNAKFDFEQLLWRPSRPPRSHRQSLRSEPISSSDEE